MPTSKQLAFVEYYLIYNNATKAALLAGYSERSACSIGWENLRKPEIQNLITDRLDELKMQADEVLLRLAEHARGSMGDFVTIGKDGLPYIDLSLAAERGIMHLIKKLNYDKDGQLRSIELYDAQAALGKIGAHHRLFIERHEISTKDDKPLIVLDI